MPVISSGLIKLRKGSWPGFVTGWDGERGLFPKGLKNVIKTFQNELIKKK